VLNDQGSTVTLEQGSSATLAAERTTTPTFKFHASELVVHGRELHLRYPGPADAPALFELASDPEVTRFFSWGPYAEVGEAESWLRTLPARRASGEALELAVVEDSGRLLGITLLSEFSRRDRRCVVGTWLGREHWGTGVNLQAKALVAHLAFGALGVERVGAYADVRNGRSQAALERVGFTREGVLRSFHRHEGEPRNVVSFGLLRDYWSRSPLAAVEASISGDLPPAFRACASASASR
jgi:ribosomal-protein-alanine N-acetyltransferase